MLHVCIVTNVGANSCTYVLDIEKMKQSAGNNLSQDAVVLAHFPNTHHNGFHANAITVHPYAQVIYASPKEKNCIQVLDIRKVTFIHG